MILPRAKIKQQNIPIKERVGASFDQTGAAEDKMSWGPFFRELECFKELTSSGNSTNFKGNKSNKSEFWEKSH